MKNQQDTLVYYNRKRKPGDLFKGEKGVVEWNQIRTVEYSKTGTFFNVFK